MSRPRPKQGAQLAQLRKAAGLSQYQLAQIVGVPQPNIAFWELSSKPPRSEVLPSLALALGVSPIDILNIYALPKSPKSALPKLKPGPIGKLRKLFDQISLLPRHQQDKLADFISFFLKQYHSSKSPNSQD